jgi:serine/threonine-protein kinase
MLAGASPFEGITDLSSMREAKRNLWANLPVILPKDLMSSELLLNFCRKLVAPDPGDRFPSAEAANLFKEGAANFQRQLIKGDLASEYDNEIRHWIEELRDRK